MQYIDMVNLASDIIGDSSSATILRLKKFINFGQQDIHNRKAWPFMYTSATFSTVNGTSHYSLSANCNTVIDVIDATNNFYIQEVNDRMLDALRPIVSSTDKGNPQKFTLRGIDSTGATVIQLYPTPAGTYTVNYNYWKQMSDLVNDTDISVIPVQFHQLLVYFALFNEFAKRQSPMFTYYSAEYENGISRMFDAVDLTDANPSIMTPSRGTNYYSPFYF